MATRLVHGVRRFRSDVFDEERALYERLAGGQRPDTLFITCSDSRLLPNAITQTGPGELFVLRNAGNLVPAHGVPGGEAATIEYAVRALGVRDVVVCGHSGCGAIKALLDPASTEGLPLVRDWLRHAAAVPSILESLNPGLTDSERLTAAIEENVLVQIEHLQTHPAVAAALLTGRLHLHAWVFDLATGEVSSYDSDEGRFRPVSDRPVPHPRAPPPPT
jgi:carbonic anhydrase